MAVKVREDVPLKELLLTVEGELLGADRAHLPVALHVLLEAALLKVGREDHLAQRAALVDVTTGERKGEGRRCVKIKPSYNTFLLLFLYSYVTNVFFV